MYSNDNSNDNKITIIKKKLINYIDAKYLLFFYQVVLYSDLVLDKQSFFFEEGN